MLFRKTAICGENCNGHIDMLCGKIHTFFPSVKNALSKGLQFLRSDRHVVMVTVIHSFVLEENWTGPRTALDREATVGRVIYEIWSLLT